jgi:acetyl esterase/lipase
MTRLLHLCLPLLWSLTALAGEPRPVTVPYLDGGGDAQSIDVFAPAGARGAPVLLFFHGGVWRGGDKSDYANVGRAFAAKGIVTGVVNYRLVPAATYAEQLADAGAAVAWMSAHAAEYGADPKRLYLAGHSSGGHLISSLLFGPKPPPVAGLIPMSGIFDLNQPIADDEGGGFEDFIIPVFGRDRARRASLSSLRAVGFTSVRMLVVVAGDDSATMKAQTQRFESALGAQKVPFQHDVAAGRGHFEMVTELGTAGDPTTDRIASFVLESHSR